MLKLLRHLLCLGILFGLVGNGVALAAPCILMTQDPSSVMADMPDCPMSERSSQNRETEKGKTANCMAQVGCSAFVAIRDSITAPAFLDQSSVHRRLVAAALAGRNVSPELEPPTLFG